MAAAVGAEPLPHLAALWPSGSKCRPRSPWGFWKWQLWYSPIFSSNFCHPSVLNLTFKSSDKLSPFPFHFFSHIQHFVLTWLHTQVTSSFTAAPFQALNSPPNFAKPVLFTVEFSSELLSLGHQFDIIPILWLLWKFLFPLPYRANPAVMLSIL